MKNRLKSTLKVIGQILYILLRPAHALQLRKKNDRRLESLFDETRKLRSDLQKKRTEYLTTLHAIKEAVKLSGYTMEIRAVQSLHNGVDCHRYKCTLSPAPESDAKQVIQYESGSSSSAMHAALTELNAVRRTHTPEKTDRASVAEFGSDADNSDTDAPAT